MTRGPFDETPMRARPLSPHLQIYRPNQTMVLSILHRITGAALYVGTLALVYWLMAAAAGPEAFATAQAVFGSILGKLVLFGFTWALVHHTLGGVRHLVWDTGHGLDLPTVRLSGSLLIALSGAVTLLIWVFAWIVG